MDINPNNIDALSGLLLISIQQDKVDALLDRLAQFQERVVESLIEEGEWFLEHNSLDEAKRFFEKVLDLDPGNETTQSLLDEIS